MLPEQTVIKEARQQLRKANSWVITGLRVDGMDEELRDRWHEIVDAVLDEFDTYLEDCT